MGYKKKTGLLILLVFTVLLIGFVFMNTEKFGICPPESSICQYEYSGKIGEPTVLLSLSLFLPLLLLIFTKELVFNSWKKFALIFIPITILWIYFAPSSCGGYIPMCITKEIASMFSAGLFLIISLLIIITQSIRHAGKPDEIETDKESE